MAASAYYRVGTYYFDNSSNVLYRCTTAGDKTTAVWTPISGNSTSGITFRGVWDPAQTYNTFDQVQLGPGTSSGFYMSLVDGNQSAPDTGIGWTQISSFATWL